MNQEKAKVFLKELADAKDAEDLGMDNEGLKKLVEYGTQLEPFPESKKTQGNMVAKCLSTVYLIGEKKEGKMYFLATSDSAFVKGELYILLEIFNNFTPNELISEETKKDFYDFYNELKELVSISMNRQQGFQGIYEKIKEISSQIYDGYK